MLLLHFILFYSVTFHLKREKSSSIIKMDIFISYVQEIPNADSSESLENKFTNQCVICNENWTSPKNTTKQ